MSAAVQFIVFEVGDDIIAGFATTKPASNHHDPPSARSLAPTAAPPVAYVFLFPDALRSRFFVVAANRISTMTDDKRGRI